MHWPQSTKGKNTIQPQQGKEKKKRSVDTPQYNTSKKRNSETDGDKPKKAARLQSDIIMIQQLQAKLQAKNKAHENAAAAYEAEIASLKKAAASYKEPAYKGWQEGPLKIAAGYFPKPIMQKRKPALPHTPLSLVTTVLLFCSQRRLMTSCAISLGRTTIRKRTIMLKTT